jgi:hypothetical protein
MKEFYNLNCNVEDDFEEFFHWPDKFDENCDMVWSIRCESYSFHQLATTSFVASEQAWRKVFDDYQVPTFP